MYSGFWRVAWYFMLLGLCNSLAGYHGYAPFSGDHGAIAALFALGVGLTELVFVPLVGYWRERQAVVRQLAASGIPVADYDWQVLSLAGIGILMSLTGIALIATATGFAR